MNNIFKFLLMIILPSIVMSFENHQLSQQLIELMKSRPEINSYLEESIQKAKKTNPDKKYNPVQSLDALLTYADDFAHTLPGQLPPGNMYHSKGTVTRESIHQNIMYFYFLLNQPLKGLENKGLFKNTLQYYPPFNQWLIALTKEKGKFLMSPSSWSEENFNQYRQSPSFNFDKGWYSQKNIWNNYNEFFSRDVVPGARPIYGLKDNSVVISPADAVPQGKWFINAKNKINVKEGIRVKYLSYFSVNQLLKDSRYAYDFKKGFLTHIYLNVNDFHRFLAPVAGTILEKKVITENMSLDVSWNNSTKSYVVIPSTGWQFSETRGYLIIRTENNDLVAISPIGMEQVSSINFYNNIQIGQKVKKGQQIGYFLFGASDIIMLFQQKSQLKITAARDQKGHYKHLLAGEAYGLIQN